MNYLDHCKSEMRRMKRISEGFNEHPPIKVDTVYQNIVAFAKLNAIVKHGIINQNPNQKVLKPKSNTNKLTIDFDNYTDAELEKLFLEINGVPDAEGYIRDE